MIKINSLLSRAMISWMYKKETHQEGRWFHCTINALSRQRVAAYTGTAQTPQQNHQNWMLWDSSILYQTNLQEEIPMISKIPNTEVTGLLMNQNPSRNHCQGKSSNRQRSLGVHNQLKARRKQCYRFGCSWRSVCKHLQMISGFHCRSRLILQSEATFSKQRRDLHWITWKDGGATEKKKKKLLPSSVFYLFSALHVFLFFYCVSGLDMHWYSP